MNQSARAARLAAAGVALVAWAGLGLQLQASFALVGSVPDALWAMARYFTIITNALVAGEFTGLAAGRPWFAAPVRTGGVTVLILLVGIVYAVLLRGVFVVSGVAWVADVILHRIVPVLVTLYWLLLVPHGGLRRRDPWLWAVIPTLYLPYALARGAFEGRYAYPFIDLGLIGWPQLAVTAGGIALCYLVAGHALLALDHRLAARRPAP